MTIQQKSEPYRGYWVLVKDNLARNIPVKPNFVKRPNGRCIVITGCHDFNLFIYRAKCRDGEIAWHIDEATSGQGVAIDDSKTGCVVKATSRLSGYGQLSTNKQKERVAYVKKLIADSIGNYGQSPWVAQNKAALQALQDKERALATRNMDAPGRY